MIEKLSEVAAHPLRVACVCGHIGVYDDVDAFEASDGRLVYDPHSDLFAAVCPTCSSQRPVRSGVISWDDGTEMCLALGSFEEGYDPFGADIHGEYDPSRTDFDGVADPVYIARQHLDPTCIRCGARVTEDDHREDSNAPEVGYEYYECSECGNRMRPEVVETQRDDD